MGVDRAHEQRISGDGDATVHAAAAGARHGRRRVRIGPEDAAGHGIERDDVIGRLYGVHDAIDDEWRGFELFERTGLVDPFQLEVFYVLWGHLIQRAVALAHHVTGIGEPVLRLFAGIHQPIEGHLRGEGSGN